MLLLYILILIFFFFVCVFFFFFFFFSSRRRHTRSKRDWSSDACSSDLHRHRAAVPLGQGGLALLPERAVEGRPVRQVEQEVAELPPELALQVAGLQPDVVAQPDPEQIGRASCRERVWISVVHWSSQSKI